MRRLSRREARLVALLLLAVAVAIVYFAVVNPIVAGFSDRAEQRQALIQRYEVNGRIIAAIPRQRRMAEARSRIAADYTMAANDSASAGEALRARLQTQVLASGGEFLSGEDMTAPAHAAAVRVSMRIEWPLLLKLLTNIENGRPYLTIASLAIGADDALVTGQATKLDVQLEATIPFKPAAAR
jgi:hypothetical protein